MPTDFQMLNQVCTAGINLHGHDAPMLPLFAKIFKEAFVPVLFSHHVMQCQLLVSSYKFSENFYTNGCDFFLKHLVEFTKKCPLALGSLCMYVRRFILKIQLRQQTQDYLGYLFLFLLEVW